MNEALPTKPIHDLKTTVTLDLPAQFADSSTSTLVSFSLATVYHSFNLGEGLAAAVTIMSVLPF